MNFTQPSIFNLETLLLGPHFKNNEIIKLHFSKNDVYDLQGWRMIPHRGVNPEL